ncbi:MAG: hypothetical protein WBG01_08595 [Bacteroidota bacterium]
MGSSGRDQARSPLIRSLKNGGPGRGAPPPPGENTHVGSQTSKQLLPQLQKFIQRPEAPLVVSGSDHGGGHLRRDSRERFQLRLRHFVQIIGMLTNPFQVVQHLFGRRLSLFPRQLLQKGVGPGEKGVLQTPVTAPESYEEEEGRPGHHQLFEREGKREEVGHPQD